MLLPRFQSWFTVRFCGRFALLAAFVGGCSLLLAQATNTEAPPSIQRIFIQPERAAKELEKAQPGALLMLPRKEFEDRVERVRQAQQARAQKPHLLRAHYAAELIDRSLTNGSGQWTVAHAGAAAAILPIDPLNLALVKPRWEQGGDALLAELDGKSLGLLVKHLGSATCLFDWSTRGAATNDAIVFNLAVPRCTISTFELTLPADCWLTAPGGSALVTGPHAAESSSKRLWKLQVTGSTSITVLIRKIAEPNGPPATVFARVDSIQQLAPDRLTVEHTFQLDILHNSVRELILESDAGLQPFAVVLPGVEVKAWQFEELPAKTDGKGKLVGAGSGLIHIQFQEPIQGEIQALRVRSLVARPQSGVWTSPALRVRHAIPRGETLEVRVHPDLAVGRWDSGSFQPIHVATDPDGTQKLTLAEAAPDPAASRRPSLIFPVKGIDLHTTESYVWEITQRGAILDAEIQFAPARGQLFELRLKVPATFPGYAIESLQLQPEEMRGGWRLEGAVLVVELKHPLMPAKKATLKVQMRSSTRASTTGIRVLNYPGLEPIDATKRAGTLAIVVEPIFLPQLAFASVPLAPSAESLRAKGTAAPTYRFVFRDKGPSVAVRLIPQSVQVQLHGKHTITLAEPHAALRFRWDVQPLVGAPDFLDFRLAPGFPSEWKVNAAEDTLRIHHGERLPLQEALPHLLQLGSGNGLQAASLASLTPTGAYWRFFLSEPLRKNASFTLEATAPAGLIEDEWRRVSLLAPSGNPWECLAGAVAPEVLPKSGGAKVWAVPLMTPVQSTNVHQEIDVGSPNEPIHRFTDDGSLQGPAAALPSDKATASLQLHQAGDPRLKAATMLTLWTRPEKRLASQLELCDEARVTTIVYKDGRVFHRVQFRIWHWRDRTFDLRLPAEARVVSVKLHDRGLERLDVAQTKAHVRLTLPFDQNAAFVRYDILMRDGSPESLLPGLLSVETPSIRWPTPPTDVQTRVCLEKGWTPLGTGRLSAVGVPKRIAEQTETPRRLRQIWNWGRSWWPYSGEAEMVQKLAAQKQLVLAAAAQRRDTEPRSMKLSELLERLALNHLKDQAPLVIDLAAFRALGLTTQTSVAPSGRPFWETLGLVYFPCPSGAVLTTQARLRSLGIDGPLEALELDDAVQEAILHGQDASSGFCLILTWLKLPPTSVFMDDSSFDLTEADHLGEAAPMSQWEIRADPLRAGRIYVIDPALARIAGWTFAALIALLLWQVQRRVEPIVFFRISVTFLTVGVLLLIWSPPSVREFFALPAFFACSAAAIGSVLRLLVRSGDAAVGANTTVSRVKVSAAVLGVLLLGLSFNATAQGPATRIHTVFVIDGPKPAVLVTPDLIAKLDDLEKQPALGVSGAVLVSGKYVGKAKDAQVTFDVQYEIFSFSDQANLVIPLTGSVGGGAGIQLGVGAFLDGTPVFPAPHKNGGYILPIRGKGPHHLRLSFSTRASAEIDELDLSFKIPKLAQSDFSLQWTAPVRGVYCQYCCGEEKSLPDPAQAVKQWQAQLGYENTVHLRWTSSAGSALPKTIEVKEAHFWDLRPAAPALVTSLSYALGKGSLGQLTVHMPEGLNVRVVEVVAGPPLLTSGAPIVVKQWKVEGKGDQRQLTVDLAQPVSGNVVLNLDIVPPAFAPKNKLLLLPAPKQGKSVGGLLGYRLDAAEIQRFAQNLGVQRMNADDFEQLWKKQSTQPLPAASGAYSFQRNATKAWMELITQPQPRQAQGHLQWNLDRHGADLNATFTIANGQEDLVFVEFFVDKAVTLADVAGPDVRRWNVQESLLQVWLRQPRKETTLKLTGWRSLPFKGAAMKNQPFVLPCIYPLQTQLGAITLELKPGPGIHVELDNEKNPKTGAGSKAIGLRANPAAGKFHYTIDKTPYEASFHMTSQTAPPEASMLTKVFRTEQGIEVWHGIRLTTQRGQLPTLKLHLKDWPHAPLVVDAPGASVQPIKNSPFKHPAWTLKYPSDLPQEVFITLRGRVAKDKHTSMSLPTVELDGAVVRRHWLAWTDVEVLHADTGKKISLDKSVKDTMLAFPGDVWFKDILAWNHAQAERSLTATLPRTPPRTSMRILSSTESARPAGLDRWLHEASCWIVAPEATDLRVRFPVGAESLSVWIDHRLHSAMNPTTHDYVLPLEGGPLPRFIELRWQYPASVEPADAPIVAAVQFDQAPLQEHERIVWLPPGATAETPRPVQLPSLFERLLHDAYMHMQIAASLAQEPLRSTALTKRIAARQQSFFAALRDAEYAQAILRTVHPSFDSARGLTRMIDLKRRNAELAKEGRYDAARKDAENSKNSTPRESMLPDDAAGGLPLLVAPNVPSVSLYSEPSLSFSLQRTRSYLILLGAIFLLIFSCIRHGWSMVKRLSPEIALALAALAMTLFGLSLIGVMFVGMMVCVRAWWLGRALANHFGAAAPASIQIEPPVDLPTPPAPGNP